MLKYPIPYCILQKFGYILDINWLFTKFGN